MEARITTVAYRRGVLAFDGRASNNGVVVCDNSVKGIVTKTVLAGYCGNSAYGHAFLEWVRKGMLPDKLPKTADNTTEEITGFVVDRKGFITEYEKGMLPFPLGKKEFHAAGSGWELAIGAMAAGASAEEAVRIASRFDCYTGGLVRVVSFKQQEK